MLIMISIMSNTDIVNTRAKINIWSWIRSLFLSISLTRERVSIIVELVLLIITFALIIVNLVLWDLEEDSKGEGSSYSKSFFLAKNYFYFSYFILNSNKIIYFIECIFCLKTFNFCVKLIKWILDSFFNA